MMIVSEMLKVVDAAVTPVVTTIIDSVAFKGKGAVSLDILGGFCSSFPLFSVYSCIHFCSMLLSKQFSFYKPPQLPVRNTSAD